MHLPSILLKTDPRLSAHFMPHQINWIEAEDTLHAAHQTVFALAEKSVRIGWTRADAFKNVRKRLRLPNRDYLFVTRDYPSALEYMKVAYADADLFNLTSAILTRGEEYLKVPRLDRRGRSTAFTDEIKIGLIKFDNGSRIIAFSSNPQAMAVYGGDVGLDEFAKHPNAELLWETAQGRITWGFDLAVWSAHNGEDTLFYQFALQARAACLDSNPRLSSIPLATEAPSSTPSLHHSTTPLLHPSKPPSLHDSTTPWNLYYRVTMPDALHLGLLDKINHARGTRFTPERFLANCRARAGTEQIYQQTYLCNPVPGGASIVDWSILER
jgi:phage FluMu gp28-like protein